MANVPVGKSAAGGENRPDGEPTLADEAHGKDRSGSDSPSSPSDRTASKWLRYRLAGWMVLAGILVGVVGYLLIPSGSRVVTPAYTAITFTTTAHYDDISFIVYQSKPLIETVVIQASAHGKTAHTTSNVSLYLPPGVKFQNCHSGCNNNTLYPAAIQELSFKGKVAYASFTVNSARLAWTSDGTSATAVLPEVIYNGPGAPLIFVYYPIANAVDYDWSSLPAAFVQKNQIAWGESLINGHAAERVATGINHTTQQTVANLTFLAGALVGAAAGAIVGALQEALRVHYER
jgi:hypothetical protein